MLVSYIRISHELQDESRQVEMAKQHNAERLFIDKASGKNAERPNLKEMLGFVREGDIVMVESISRLARNTRDLLRIVAELNEKKVQFKSLKENIDTTTPTGRFTLTIFGALAELERENINSNQKEGIAIAKRLGKYKGRAPKKIDVEKFKLRCSQWQKDERDLKDIIEEFGITLTTFFRWTKKYGIKKRPLKNKL
jgi:DNA invertase Pin-like site-specific DNA recombinase